MLLLLSSIVGIKNVGTASIKYLDNSIGIYFWFKIRTLLYEVFKRKNLTIFIPMSVWKLRGIDIVKIYENYGILVCFPAFSVIWLAYVFSTPPSKYDHLEESK